MTLRSGLLIFILLTAATTALAQREGDVCDAGVSPDVCVAGDASVLLSCSDFGRYESSPCDAQAPGSACGVVPCVGERCNGEVRCLASSPDRCIGVGPLLDFDAPNKMRVPCVDGDACLYDRETGDEQCVARPVDVATCGAGSPAQRCVGDKVVFCIDLTVSGTAMVTSPAIEDCAAQGLTCNERDGDVGCGARVDDTCSDGSLGRCEGNVAVRCGSNGQVSTRTDCTTSGQQCIDDDGTTLPTCVNVDAACGPAGLGVCDGNVATICAQGAVVNTTDCTTLGRTCRAVDADGTIGCAANGGGGEGEGEGEDTAGCANNADCDDDETCDDGECVRDRPVRGGSDDDGDNDAGSCASGAAAPAGLLGVLLLARRRRATLSAPDRGRRG